MDEALVSDEETGSDLHAHSSEHKCRSRTASVENSASRKYRNVKCVNDLRYKGHRVVVTYVSA